ncbi:MAG: gliding motility-associated ABC transporter substrate-binding protein GldG [Ferruginibacter sp.]
MKNIFSHKWILPVVLVILVGLNWAATAWHARIDLTEEKRFTLSKSTRDLLKQVKEPLHIDVFLKGNYPSGFRKLSATSEEILNEFKEIAGPNLTYSFLSPDETVPGSETSYGDSLSALGLYPINLTSQVEQGQQQQYVYPVALLHYKEKTEPVLLYKGKTPLINYTELNSAEALLEYNLGSAISRLVTEKKPVVAYSNGNGEPVDYRTYDLIENVLKTDYQLFTYSLAAPGPIPQDFKTLMIVKPSRPFTDIMKLKMDQYLMQGGNILLFVDRLNAEMDSLQIKNEVIAFDRDLQLNDLLFKYGVRVNADLVMDLQCDFLPFDVNGNGQFELLPWNYFPVLEGYGTSPIVKNMGFVAGRFVNSIDTVLAEGIKKTILLSSSVNSRTLATPALISGRENVNAPEDAKYNKKQIPVAVMLEGVFTSYFRNRLSQEMSDSLNASGSIFRDKSNGNGKLIVVSDGDIPLNSVIKGGQQPIPMGMNPYTFGTQREFPFANKEFIQNCLEAMVNSGGLAEAKSKDYVVRMLDPKKIKENKTAWQVLNIAGPVLLVGILSVIFYFLRRRKYSRPF